MISFDLTNSAGAGYCNFGQILKLSGTNQNHDRGFNSEASVPGAGGICSA